MITDNRPGTLGGEIRKTYSTAMIISLIVILAAMTISKILEYRDEFIDLANTDVSIISLNLEPALLFGDQTAAKNFVTSLSSNRAIEIIEVYDSENRLYCSYKRPNITHHDTGSHQACEYGKANFWSSTACGQIIATDPINKGKRLGTIYLHYSLTRFYKEGMEVFISLALAFAVSYRIGLSYIRRRQRYVVDPIKKLTSTTHSISVNRDYSLNLQTYCKIDEIIKLTDSFNHMMDQINKRDIELEKKVATRTRQLSEYANEMEQTNEDLRNFMYIFHHDLRTPILTMTCYVEETAEIVNAMRSLAEKYTPFLATEDKMALAMILGEETIISIESLRESVLAVKNMFQSVVNISQISDMTVEPKECEIAELLQKTAEAKKEQALLNEVLLKIYGIDGWMTTDPSLLQKILGHLLDNAIRFSCQSTNKVVALDATENSESWILTVQDTGPGISNAEIEYIFDLFRRGETSQKNEGMGLTYAKALARRINARITVQSELGRGCIFTVIIPKPAGKETVYE